MAHTRYCHPVSISLLKAKQHLPYVKSFTIQVDSTGKHIQGYRLHLGCESAHNQPHQTPNRHYPIPAQQGGVSGELPSRAAPRIVPPSPRHRMTRALGTGITYRFIICHSGALVEPSVVRIYAQQRQILSSAQRD